MIKCNQRTKQRAFTLVETMVTVGVGSFVSLGMMMFLIMIAKDYSWSSNKSLITTDVRNFTMELSKEVRTANAAYVYSSFASADRDSQSDRRGNGESGDCLLLIYSTPYPEVDDERCVTDIIVYYRQADGEGRGPVYRFKHSYAEADYLEASEFESKTIEDILTGLNTSGTHPEVIELSKGLANGKLFVSQEEGAFILVNGEIIHGENENSEVTNTYNLTISTRG